MFAVIKTGGKQYRVSADDVITIDRHAGDAGSTIEFGEVLAWGDGDGATFGTPFVDGARVMAEVVGQGRGRTVIAFKKRRRQNSRRKRGIRVYETTVRIVDILAGGKSAPKKAKAESAPTAVAEDVSLISGVGPALKERLAGAGITALSQIAALKKKDAAKLDDELELGGRIEREEWIQQAKDLVAGKPPRAKVDQEAANGGAA